MKTMTAFHFSAVSVLSAHAHTSCRAETRFPKLRCGRREGRGREEGKGKRKEAGEGKVREAGEGKRREAGEGKGKEAGGRERRQGEGKGGGGREGRGGGRREEKGREGRDACRPHVPSGTVLHAKQTDLSSIRLRLSFPTNSCSPPPHPQRPPSHPIPVGLPCLSASRSK